MPKQLEKKLAAVRLRCGINNTLLHAAVVLAVAGVVAAAGVAVQRTFGVPVLQAWAVWAFVGAVAVAIAALSLFRLPNRMGVALLMDRRLAFRERFSTALALSDREDPFARAASREAHRAAERLDIRGRFPVRPSGHWVGTLGAWLIAVGVFLFLPEDVLGYIAQRRRPANPAAEIRTVEAVEKVLNKVKASVNTIHSEELLSEMEDLGKVTKGVKPTEVRREAIRKLSSLADKLREMEQSEQALAGDMMSKMLRNLRSHPNALNNELNRALATGNFDAAAKMLQQMLQQANEGTLSEEQKKRLAEQLRDLAEQMEKLAGQQQQQQQREQMLQKQGLDAETAKKLAGLSEQELREQLKQQGLNDQQIDEMMEKMAAAQKACQNCQQLSQAMGKCSGQQGRLVPDGMRELVESLENMDAQSVERDSMEEALRDIERAIAGLGEQDGEGMDFDPNMLDDAEPGQVIWRPDGKLEFSKGNGGGRGRAWGLRPTGEPEDVGHKKTGVQNKPPKDDAEIVASWLYKGGQVKGVSKRKLENVVQASSDAAAEAIKDNKIPKKYATAVKKYFGGFQNSVPADANTP